jgi:hypothetical protein
MIQLMKNKNGTLIAVSILDIRPFNRIYQNQKEVCPYLKVVAYYKGYSWKFRGGF